MAKHCDSKKRPRCDKLKVPPQPSFMVPNWTVQHGPNWTLMPILDLDFRSRELPRRSPSQTTTPLIGQKERFQQDLTSVRPLPPFDSFWSQYQLPSDFTVNEGISGAGGEVCLPSSTAQLGIKDSEQFSSKFLKRCDEILFVLCHAWRPETWSWPDGADPPPTIEYDLYSLDLSLWELYTRRTPFEGWYEDDIMYTLQQGETVDVDEVEDEDVKSVICHYLRMAKVFPAIPMFTSANAPSLLPPPVNDDDSIPYLAQLTEVENFRAQLRLLPGETEKFELWKIGRS
ncbi:hypothetical protein CPC735_007590 [Coccidioides posadasii C735 delta SOWgp]|uniref:Uncharacterized protein n=1 Tax=Coccidioides posadasii (strain C735) TaxID=222929 RepID=C5PA24_COCP7|nr:hypothetical protein CPC735_007590 [Coccidioides posadasii C735 delta SOWgp]EER26586.1 hypothetical protein CPC735_007590 [Coccidioides posadasii C735 delta SOWgp]|eukprot:XP_003068731.1 hypothetical protein CPC735_007590 [Coccidioides posadasii C735 delta SOWgp]